jgi:CheY-like chemotaxis protein
VADSNNAGAIRLCWQYFGEGHRRRRATFKSLPITRRRRNQTGCGYGLFPGDVLPCVYSAIGDLTSAIPRRSVGHRRAQEGISLLINRTDGFECRHLYGSMEAALEGIGVNPPRVVLVDIGLPGLDGIDGLRILQERYPRIAPVMLTVYKDDDRIFRAMCAGACGYLLKNTPPTLLPSGEVLVAGGFGTAGEGNPIAGAELYNPATDKWTATGSMSSARDRRFSGTHGRAAGACDAPQHRQRTGQRDPL